MTEQTERVAIIAVHGVADQEPGQTVGELARLLCHGGGGPPRYVEGEIQEVLVPVGALHPSRVEPDSLARAERRLNPGRPSEFFLEHRSASIDAATPELGDLGLALTHYLQRRYRPVESDALYQSTRISLRRQADRKRVDLYELYWADYSRLKPGGFRALSAAYQLLFHLNTLSRDVVDHVALATGRAGALPVLQWLHAWSAWLVKGPAALLQLTLLLLVAFGATAFVAPDWHEPILRIGGAVAAAALIGVALLAAQRASGTVARLRAAIPWTSAALVCSAIAAAVVLIDDLDRIYFAAAMLLTSALGLALLQRYCKTVRGVRLIGFVALFFGIAMLLVSAARTRSEMSSLSEWQLTAAFNAGEYVFAVLLCVMAVLVLAEIVALLVSFSVGRRAGREVAASLTTARIGMVVSTSLFTILSLVLWSVISYVVGLSLNDLLYAPVVFGRGYRSAAIFFDAQIADLGRLFTPLLAMVSVVGVITIVGIAPSLREEVSPSNDEQSVGWTLKLGRWWTGARRTLGYLFGVIVPLLGIIGSMLYLSFVGPKLFGIEGALEWLDQAYGEVLVGIGKWVAGGALTITALGARFTRTFGKLRVALDAMLDVDNYFQDPINRLPPRARIFSRYAALLDYVRGHGYTRLVIVSHSQGTVISADVLRYLDATNRLHEFTGGIPLSLVTVGSPLRDLYAARFPALYRWMGEPPESFENASPRASDVAAGRWTNAYRAGDYVGRSIWTPPTSETMFRVATVSANGQIEGVTRCGDRTEFCLGAGAHTHYFTNDAVALAVEIDELVG